VSAPTLPEEPAERVASVLAQVVEALDLEAEVSVEETDEEIAARVDGEDVGVLIGRRGQTIDAVQLVCYRIAFRGRGDRKRVTVDASGYRERRRETLERQADRAAERALETGKEIEIEPMSSNERKVIHDRLKERPGIETFSEGEEPERCVIVAPLVGD
jgi:spoIIIJ-associated protein